MRPNLILGGALVLVILTGILHGVWTERWGGNDQLVPAAQRLETVPDNIGDWSKRQDQSLSAAQVERAELAGYLQRPYSNADLKQTVLMMLLCGRFGPISVHTPEVCYGGAGYVMVGNAIRYEVQYSPDRPPAQFWTARFHKPGAADAAPLRIFWSWSVDGTWQAPEYPRIAFRRAPVLYKLYLVREMATLVEPLENDGSIAFMKVLLPVLDRSLFQSVDNAGVRPTLEVLAELNIGKRGCLENETQRPQEFLPQHNCQGMRTRRRLRRSRKSESSAN